MAKRDYNKISTNQPVVEKENPNVPVTDEESVAPVIEEKAEDPEIKAAVIGVVTKCQKLNIRKKPDIKSEIVCQVPNASKLELNLDKSTNKWFKVCTESGLEGFCMKDYVDAQK